jgi:DNA mismatch repair protein MutS2
MIISGPNTGGKTAVLKLVGMLVTLARRGYLVTATAFELPRFDAVYADIGDEQSLNQSLSTFSSHLLRIKEIMHRATKDSLVLLDELGSGTDPLEGSSLAKAILTYLLQKGVTVFCTTHYLELKKFSVKRPDLIPAAVLFDAQTYDPLYTLQQGRYGRSIALEIASRLGLHPHVVQQARNEMQNKAGEISVLFDSVNTQQEALTQEQNRMKELKQSLLSQKAALEAEQANFRLQQKQLVEEAVREQRQALEQQLEALQTLMKQLPSTPRGQIQQSIKQLQIEKAPPSFKKGDAVIVTELDAHGVIIDIQKEDYYVRVGNFDLKFTANQLQPETKPQTSSKFSLKNLKPRLDKPQETVLMPSTKEPLNPGVLDLRGVRGIDVQPQLEGAILQARGEAREQLKVIHGFGTGMVKSQVEDYIRKHPEYQTWPAQANDGGFGVTYFSWKRK